MLPGYIYELLGDPQKVNNEHMASGPVLPGINDDGPIRANRFADSRKSLDARESLQGSRTEPLFCESRFGGLSIAHCRFEAICPNRSHCYDFFLRINLREVPRFCVANRRAI